MSFAITCSIFSISGTVIKNGLPYSNTLKINAKHAKTNQKTWTICNTNNNAVSLHCTLCCLVWTHVWLTLSLAHFHISNKCKTLNLVQIVQGQTAISLAFI